jgi:predicted transcriptional regulator|tara:strand:+ start:5196 stop:5465 length:270 start_codon:yes stop_codon:yes gene_type:complete
MGLKISKDLAFITSGKSRKEILLILCKTPKTPTLLCNHLGKTKANVGKTLRELLNKKFVKKEETNSKSKYYSLTEKGSKIANDIMEHGL